MSVIGQKNSLQVNVDKDFKCSNYIYLNNHVVEYKYYYEDI